MLSYPTYPFVSPSLYEQPPVTIVGDGTDCILLLTLIHRNWFATSQMLFKRLVHWHFSCSRQKETEKQSTCWRIRNDHRERTKFSDIKQFRKVNSQKVIKEYILQNYFLRISLWKLEAQDLFNTISCVFSPMNRSLHAVHTDICTRGGDALFHSSYDGIATSKMLPTQSSFQCAHILCLACTND